MLALAPASDSRLCVREACCGRDELGQSRAGRKTVGASGVGPVSSDNSCEIAVAAQPVGRGRQLYSRGRPFALATRSVLPCTVGANGGRLYVSRRCPPLALALALAAAEDARQKWTRATALD